MRISNWSSDVCSSDLPREIARPREQVRLLHPHAIEEHVGRRDAAEPHHPFLIAEAQAGGSHVDEHRADALRALDAVEPAEDDIDAPNARARTPTLGADAPARIAGPRRVGGWEESLVRGE